MWVYSETTHLTSQNPLQIFAADVYPPKWCHFLEDDVIKELDQIATNPES